jgi:molecular chaperone HscB
MNLLLKPPRFLVHKSLQRALSSRPTRNCPKCSAPLQSTLPACASCHHIEPLPWNTRFETILGLETESSQNPFQIDQKLLRSRFLEAQRVCHPDAWSGRGREEEKIASDQSTLVNTAYRTLKDPLLRAEYLLRTLSNLETKEEDGAKDLDLVSEVMMAQEEVESSDDTELDELLAQNATRIAESESEIERFIGSGHFASAKQAADALRYWRGIERAIQRKKGFAID